MQGEYEIVSGMNTLSYQYPMGQILLYYIPFPIKLSFPLHRLTAFFAVVRSVFANMECMTAF